MSAKRLKTASREDLSVGRPRYRPVDGAYTTEGGVQVTRSVKTVDHPKQTIEWLIKRCDEERGAVFESAYEFPGM